MPWDPLHDLVAFHDRAIERHGGEWTPAVDLYETPDRYVLVVELPGLAAGDFALTAAVDSVTISGRRPALDVVAQQYLRIERGHGEFSRTFSFPDAIEVGGIHAGFEDGLLTVTVPKREAAASLRIDVD